MDLHLKQWRNQHESEQQPPPAKIPKLLLDLHHQHQNQHASSETSSALPLFVSSDQSNTKISGNMSAPLSDSNTRMGSYFSLAQWQELELQALIYRYMLAGAAVPPELLQPIKKSLLYSSTYFVHHPYPHYQPPLLQSGYWGRGAMDPEPGRCRRTDGKKWRCSRDVVTGQKYCERHVHRGRNRSRKPVEMPPTSNSSGVTVANNNAATRFGGGASGADAIGCVVVKASSPMAASPFAAMANDSNNFGLSRPSPPVDLLQLNHSSSEPKNEHTSPFEAQSDVDNRSGGHILRPFFDDWPRKLQDPDNNGANATQMSSATCLSISMPGNSSSDVSLKLSTGNGDQLGPSDSGRDHQHQPPMNWGMGGWAASASMGGPLAEALRSSSTSNSSPTSVLH